MRLLKALSVVAVVIFVAFGARNLLDSSSTAPIGGSLDLASLSESGWRLPVDDVKTAMADARTSMLARSEAGARFARIATAVTWLNILCSIAISLILGWSGHPVSAANASGLKRDDIVGLPGRLTKIIGFCAALAGAAAFGGSEASKYSQARHASAERLNVLISETLRALDGGDMITQREALDRLRLSTRQP